MSCVDSTCLVGLKETVRQQVGEEKGCIGVHLSAPAGYHEVPAGRAHGVWETRGGYRDASGYPDNVHISMRIHILYNIIY